MKHLCALALTVMLTVATTSAFAAGGTYTPWQYDQSHHRWYCQYKYQNHNGQQKTQTVLRYHHLSPWAGYYYWVNPASGNTWARCVSPDDPNFDPNCMAWQKRVGTTYQHYSQSDPCYCPEPPDGGGGITQIPDPPVGDS